MATQTIINEITYTDKNSSDAILIKNIKEIEGQTVSLASKKQIEAKYSVLSERNSTGTNIIPTDAEKVFINFIPQKTVVSDDILTTMLQPEFEFFKDEIIIPDEKFTLADGEFYRCASDTPQPKENYTYYVMQGGKATVIPNYKTLEVMLAERNLTLLSVRVLEKNQCQDIEKSTDGTAGDKTNAWNSDFADVTNIETLKKMQDNAKSADAVAEGAKASAQQQIDAVKAEAAASKAQAEAEKAKADQAKAEADAAKAQADADKEKAKQAQAEADAQKAEAEAKQAELDAQLANGGKKT
jgi:chemotaxis protein histidine kinase CheA